MSKDIKKALEHCINVDYVNCRIDNGCIECPNNEELGSGKIVCRARLLQEVLEYISDLQHKLDILDKVLELACSHIPCKTCPHSNGINICYIEQDVGHFQSEQDCIANKGHYFKKQAEKELKGE